MSFQLEFIYLFLFIYLSVFSFFSFFDQLIYLLKLHCQPTSYIKHYLVLLSSISFLVIMSKHYLGLY